MGMLAERLAAVRPSETKAMTQRAATLRAAGKDIITLSQGEPDFETPESVQKAGISAITNGFTKYTAVAGVEALRAAIKQKFKRDNDLDYAIEEITVGCGAKQVLFNGLMATLDPGDEVVMPTPCWVSYPDMVSLAGGVPIAVLCGEEDGFKLTPARLEAAITPRTKWLMLNSPSNPTGAVYSGDELAALAEVLRRHPRVLISSDDIYEKLVYGDVTFKTIAQVAPDLKERTLTINGVSKSACMTGWRVGYGAGPVELISAMNKIQGQTTSHTSTISQYAAIHAIIGIENEIDAFRNIFETRRDLVVEQLNNIPGLACGRPDGAFYVFASCADIIGRTLPAGGRINSDTDFAMYLLEHAGVAVVPGSGFMASPYIRISYASSEAELQRACERISHAVANLS